MKIFTIILGDIPLNDSDVRFIKFIESNKLEWWRYTPLNFFLATPNNIMTEVVHENVMKCYPNVISAVFLIDIKEWQGIGPSLTHLGEPVSFLHWFDKIASKDFIPKWESEKRHYNKPSDHLHLIETKSNDDFIKSKD